MAHERHWLFNLAFAVLALHVPTALASQDSRQSSTSVQEESSWDTLKQKLSLNYFNVLFGPSVTHPSSYQPTLDGIHDPNRPILLKNFLTLGYALTDEVTVSATGYWMYVPVQGNEVLLKDPYMRISDESLFAIGNFNLYADFRVHFPVTWESREADLLAGFQLFQIATLSPGSSRFTFGLYTSERLNVYGGLGYGQDVELYLGPNLSYQLSPTLALTLLYETGTSHDFGAPVFDMTPDGADVETGVSWDISPALNFSPYLHMLLGEGGGWRATSLGATISWMLF